MHQDTLSSPLADRTTSRNDAESIRTEPSPDCILCRQQGRPLYEGLTDYLAETTGHWRIVRRPDPACGLLWLDPAQ